MEESNYSGTNSQSLVELTNALTESSRAINSFTAPEVTMFVESVNTITNGVVQAVNSITGTVQYCANVRLEIAKLDKELEEFVTTSNNNLERFKAAMPVLESQLTLVSKRIDLITEHIMKNLSSDLDEKDLKRHSLQLDLLSTVSDNFNNLLAKILAL